MKLKKIEIVGHIALHNKTINFQDGKTGISGKPGSGKSSIFGLWTILFFGYEPNRKSRQMRGTVYDSFRGPNCFLAGEWEISGDLIRKEITINAEKRQSSIKIFLNNQLLPGIEKSEIADSTTKKYLPFHEECYFSSVYTTQNNFSNLLSIDTKQRRNIFDKILKLEYWRNIHQKACLKKKDIKKEYLLIKEELSSTVIPTIPDFDTDKYDYYKDILNSKDYQTYLLLKKELENIKFRLSKIKDLSIEKEKLAELQLQDQKNQHQHRQDMIKHSELLTEWMNQEKRKSVLQFKLQQKKVDITCGDFFKTCPLAKNVLTEEEEFKVKQELASLILQKPKTPDYVDLTPQIKKLQDEINKSVDITEYNYLNRRSIEISYELGKFDYPENIETFFRKMDYSSYQQALEKQKKVADRINFLKEKQSILSRGLSRIQTIEDFSSHTGIQAQILEAELPSFTNLTNEILNIAFPDTFLVDLKPETMEIEITDIEKGLVSNLDSKSGFEKALILEAMSCASLIQYGRTWNFVPTFIFRDEPTASMGEYSERYMDMLDYIQKTFNIPQIFYISHDESCLSYADNRISL